MLKALNDLFIIIVCELRRWLPLSHLMKVSSDTTIITNTCSSNVKITTANNGVPNLHEL
jgi:hypothetical protein